MEKNKKIIKDIVLSLCFVFVLGIMIFFGISNTLIIKQTYAISSSDCTAAGGKMVDNKYCCPSGYTAKVLKDSSGNAVCFADASSGLDRAVDFSEFTPNMSNFGINATYGNRGYGFYHIECSDGNDSNCSCIFSTKKYDEDDLDNPGYCPMCPAESDNSVLKKCYKDNCNYCNVWGGNSNHWSTKKVISVNFSWAFDCEAASLTTCAGEYDGVACYKYTYSKNSAQVYYEWIMNANSNISGWNKTKQSTSTKASCDKLNNVTVTFYDTLDDKNYSVRKEFTCKLSYGGSGSCSTLLSGMPKTNEREAKFVGWYKSDKPVADCSKKTMLPINKDWGYVFYEKDKGAKFYACYESNVVKYKVSYNANGGTATKSSDSIESGKTATLPSASRAGYTFLGWYTASSGGTKVGNSGATYKVTKNITLYAQWKKTTEQGYRVSFDVNVDGESYIIGEKEGRKGEIIQLPSYSRNYHEFLGWYTARTGGTRVGGAGDSYTITGNVTLYAQWKKVAAQIYRVTYDANLGTGSNGPYTYSHGKAGTKIQLPPGTRDGYELLGWYTARTGGTRVGGAGDSYTITGNITLYAQWKEQEKTYRVSYNGNGGNVSVNSKTGVSGEKIKLPGATRNGYTFLGWYTSIDSGTLVGSVGDSYTITQSVTLYARWKKIEQNAKTYKIVYNGSGGSVDVSSRTGVSGEKIELPNATREGYKFVGWYTSSSGGDKVGDIGDAYTIAKDITLYARWEEITLTIVFNAEGGKVIPDKLEVKPNEEISFPDSTRDGYKFLGWAIAPASYTILGVAGDKYNVTEDVTVYAKWSNSDDLVYTASFKNYDGSVLGKSVCTITQNGESCSIASLDEHPIRDGYEFLGWAPTLSDCVNKNIWTISTTIDKDSIMYACYEAYDLEDNNDSNNYIVIIIILILVIVVGAGGFLYFKKMKEKNQ